MSLKTNLPLEKREGKGQLSIVSHILSLASCASDPLFPIFSWDTNAHFLVEMLYKIVAAVHHRHKCHRLAGIELFSKFQLLVRVYDHLLDVLNLALHVEILVLAVTQISEPDSLYGIILSNKLSVVSHILSLASSASDPPVPIFSGIPLCMWFKKLLMYRAAVSSTSKELVNAVLHNLSRQLKYTSMLKSLEELMGSIIFCLVASGVSFALAGDCWTMQFALFSLVKKMDIDHPYHTIFQLLALANGDRTKEKQCSGNSFVYWPKIVSVMRENGNLSIVSHILSLASCASDPPFPIFSRDAIVHFLVEMHYKIAAAVLCRHKCHQLAVIEVIINILGHRAAVSVRVYDNLLDVLNLSIVSLILSLASRSSDPPNMRSSILSFGNPVGNELYVLNIVVLNVRMLYLSYEDRLTSKEWQAAMCLWKHRKIFLEALIRRLKSSSKGDFPNILNLRKILLRAVLGLANWMEPSILSEQATLFLPVAVYTLCAGCARFKQKTLSMIVFMKFLLELIRAVIEVYPLQSHQGVHLLQEMETYILGSLFELWCYIGGFLKRKTCYSKEGLAAGPRPQPMLETVIFTVMHNAICTEEVELESLEELMGSIFFFLAACVVCLVALVELFHAVMLPLASSSSVRNLDGKREQLCFRVQFCVLLRYLRVNKTKPYATCASDPPVPLFSMVTIMHVVQTVVDEPSIFNARVVLFLPVAVYALCAGCAPFKQCYNRFWCHDTEATLGRVKVSPLQSYQGVRPLWHLRDQLLQEMETNILGSLVDKEIEKVLFQIYSSNFCVTLVVSSKEKLVTARDVVAAGPQPQPTLETVIITLMHIAIYSKEVELEYLGELVGSIFFCWVACGVSLVALVEDFGFPLYLLKPDKGKNIWD
ncbi:serine/threonine-protein kinase atm [Quercus suber]|uniref:Serine/threonine-protein kinase atm n=1 Tax=Quercus suber TaxID=58331 RepID=A0AAW0ITB8_QUESU